MKRTTDTEEVPVMPQLKRYLFNAALAACVCIAFLSNLAFAASSTPYCADYFLEEWNTRLDMSDKEHGFLQDIPDLQLGTITTPTYSGGVASMTTTGSSGRITPLQYTVVGSIPVGTRYGAVHPIDTSLYRYFSVRMYSSENATAQLIWYFSSDHYATTIFPIHQGWRTYSIDLAGATPVTPSAGSPLAWSSGTVQGLTFVPVNTSGTTVQVDWMQLTRADCGTYDSTYGGGSGLRKIVIDDDLDTTNGYQASSSPLSGSSHSIPKSSLFPGTYNLIGIASPDWAVINFGSGLNMSNSSDIRADAQANIGSTSFSGGTFNGVTTGSDPSFYVGIPSGQTFDPSTYQYLSIGLTMSGLSGIEGGQIHVFNSLGNVFTFGTALSNGYQVLNQSLATVTGQVASIRIDPTDNSGRTFAIDFVAIRSDGYVATGSTPTQSTIDTLTVNDLAVSLTQPDERGGSDFAQNVLGKTWNMNSASTFVQNANLASAVFYPHGSLTDPLGDVHTGDYFLGTNAANNGDPIEYLVFTNAKIDTSRYVNFCFRGWNKNETPVYNSVARLIWSDPRYTPGTGVRDGDDIVFARGNTEYCLDLRQLLYAQIEPAVSTNPWTDIGSSNGGVDFFRLDLNENSESSFYSVLDYISLRTDHEANTKFAIVVDAPLSQQVDLSYNSSASTSGGTAIGSLAAGRSTNTYSWDTTSVPEGSYYIVASITSGGNTLSHVSKGRIDISHSRTQDTTAPILNCERPYDGYLFDSTLEVAGYALDDTRIASVEVLTSTNNSVFTYLNKINRSMFHLDAQTSYTNYADANAPGFQTLFDASGLAYGTQYVKIVATDTAGNVTSCTKQTTRQVGASPTPLAYPTPDNNNSVAAPVEPTPTPTADPKLKVKLSNADVTLTITGCSGGGTVYGQTSKKLLSSNPTRIGTASTSATIAKLSTSTEKGSIYMQITCGSKKSSVASFNGKKIKSKKSTTLAKLLKQVQKKFKGQ